MTSRERTAIRPRTMDLSALAPPQLWRNRLTVIAFALIQWPWLLRSLWGGRLTAKFALLDRLGLPRTALPHLGSWKADVGFLTQLADDIIRLCPDTVVEFGMGASTLIIAAALRKAGGGALISFDQHADFVAATRRWLAEHGLAADLRTAALVPAAKWPGLWYRHGDLPEQIDLLVIDGPPWTIHPFTRGSADGLFDRVAPGGQIILDDAARPGERMIARRWRRDWPDFDWRYVRGIKGTLIGERRA
ncbi:class I SAM-dependent methyltransferase [uncultured Sphingosinicella sp.]|uniref:class I SAM-dependent methyltransferase n=1 Tax=uncultured Sphingosinicella sp. TaxID=478748 RepID=UPI0030DCBEDD